MKSVFPAHICGERVQYVEEHLRETAEYASNKLTGIGLAKTAYLAGLLHDLGKYTIKFKLYIEAAARGEKVKKGSVCHTFSGCIYLIENYYSGSAMENLTCEIIAYAIGAHHGEFDCVNFESKNGFEHRLNSDKDEILYNEAIDNFLKYCSGKDELDRLFSEATAEITGFYGKIQSFFDSNSKNVRSQTHFMLGILTRILLSAIVDADRRNTSEFMSGKSFDFICCDKNYWNMQLDFFNNKLHGFKASSPINQARKYFSDKCAEAAKNPSGLYRLTLPTGAGKTLSALRYALNHAAEHGKKRLIFVIPLLSILDQNSKVIRDYFPKDSVITEHHSDFIRPEDGDELDIYELLTETWESPVIITTLFQLLSTLFSDKISAVRRMSALADSVIVIDEVQSLPIRTMDMFCTAMNFLTGFCGADVVFSSATQPNFSNIERCPLRYSPNAEIVPYEKPYFDVFRRTEVIDKTIPYGMSIDELADFSLEISENTSSLLIICNTKTSAAALYKNINMRADAEVFFLSAAMCMAHRKNVLKTVNDILDEIHNGNDRKIICIATQLVEAGVDFSFESVIRVIAGIDNAAQAAGRCNRSSEYGDICRVYLVNLRQDYENLNMLKEIAAAQRCTRFLLSEYEKTPDKYEGDLLGDKAISDFYRSFYSDTDIQGQFDYPCKNEKLYDLLAFNDKYRRRNSSHRNYILNQSFKSAGAMFKVFEENTTDIIVPYNDEAKKIVADLNSLKAEFDIGYVLALLEKAKPYIIRIFEYQRRKLADDGMLHPCADNRAFYLNELRYDKEIGLQTDGLINF